MYKHKRRKLNGKKNNPCNRVPKLKQSKLFSYGFFYTFLIDVNFQVRQCVGCLEKCRRNADFGWNLMRIKTNTNFR